MPADVRESWDATKRVLAAEGKADELTRQRNQAWRDCEMYRKMAEVTRAELREAQKMIARLEGQLKTREAQA
jgi:hypothetical protein